MTVALSQLIYIKEKLPGVSSSLRLMVRVNVSIIHGPNGQLEYFINEVEHSAGIRLFNTKNPKLLIKEMDHS